MITQIKISTVMKNRIFSIVLIKVLSILVLLTLAYAVGAQKKEVIEPSKYVAKVVLQGKNTYTYYALSEKSRTSFKVDGPGLLEINVRVRAEEGKFKSEPFKIRHVRSDKFMEVEAIPELLAGNLKFKSKTLTGTPTKLHKIVIDVPPGKHTYSFYKERTDQKAHMRAFYKAFPKPKWKAVDPLNMVNSKTIKYIKSGTEREYHQVTKQQGLQFDINDHGSYKVTVRPEFTYSMLDETILKLKLTNLSSGDTKVYKLNSRRSNKLEFVGDLKNTPGTASSFYINLDKPMNPTEIYEFTVQGGAKAAIIKLSKDQNEAL